jgi:hypothetical protein
MGLDRFGLYWRTGFEGEVRVQPVGCGDRAMHAVLGVIDIVSKQQAWIELLFLHKYSQSACYSKELQHVECGVGCDTNMGIETIRHAHPGLCVDVFLTQDGRRT